LTFFYQITKVPILINTSFNVRNEPIVETPEDAIRCFFTTDIDLLALDKFIIDKNDQNYNSLNSLFTKNYEGEND
jgi:carbamoyltransferase